MRPTSHEALQRMATGTPLLLAPRFPARVAAQLLGEPPTSATTKTRPEARSDSWIHPWAPRWTVGWMPTRRALPSDQARIVRRHSDNSQRLPSLLPALVVRRIQFAGAGKTRNEVIKHALLPRDNLGVPITRRIALLLPLIINDPLTLPSQELRRRRIRDRGVLGPKFHAKRVVLWPFSRGRRADPDKGCAIIAAQWHHHAVVCVEVACHRG